MNFAYNINNKAKSIESEFLWFILTLNLVENFLDTFFLQNFMNIFAYFVNKLVLKIRRQCWILRSGIGILRPEMLCVLVQCKKKRAAIDSVYKNSHGLLIQCLLGEYHCNNWLRGENLWKLIQCAGYVYLAAII